MLSLHKDIAKNTKQRARYLVQRAIRRAELTRQPCDVCGATRAHAYNDDYDQPLEVCWLSPQASSAQAQPLRWTISAGLDGGHSRNDGEPASFSRQRDPSRFGFKSTQGLGPGRGARP
jgi:hypothetical protein